MSDSHPDFCGLCVNLSRTTVWSSARNISPRMPSFAYFSVPNGTPKYGANWAAKQSINMRKLDINTITLAALGCVCVCHLQHKNCDSKWRLVMNRKRICQRGRVEWNVDGYQSIAYRSSNSPPAYPRLPFTGSGHWVTSRFLRRRCHVCVRVKVARALFPPIELKRRSPAFTLCHIHFAAASHYGDVLTCVSRRYRMIGNPWYLKVSHNFSRKAKKG